MGGQLRRYLGVLTEHFCHPTRQRSVGRQDVAGAVLSSVVDHDLETASGHGGASYGDDDLAASVALRQIPNDQRASGGLWAGHHPSTIPSHDHRGMCSPSGTYSADRWYRDITVPVVQAK
jgi:hypothetical protein